MSRFERAHTQRLATSADGARVPPGPIESSSDADAAAARIAELVRRTAARQSAPLPADAFPADPFPADPFPADPFTADQLPAAPPPALPSPAPRRDLPPAPLPPAPVPPAPVPPVPAPVAREVAAPTRRPWRAAVLHPSRRSLVAGGVVAALLVGGVVISDMIGPDVGSGTGSSPAALVSTTVPDGYTVRVKDVITDCAGHARGRTKTVFETQNCVKATRLLATGRAGGRAVLFVVARIEMGSGGTAASVKQVLDGNGTGNLNDLLREGKTFRGAPAKMPSSGYASVQTGNVITVAEAGFVDGGRSTNNDPTLRSVAAEAAAMVSAQS